MATVPQELIEETLSRLPVKSLLRFKTASKNWYSLISHNHTFHLKQSSSSSSSKDLILYKMAAYSDGALFRYSDIDSYESRKIIFPIERAESWELMADSCELVGSANGLICLARYGLRKGFCFIWNPCTGDCKNISLPSSKNGFDYTTLFGFGYDSISDDYKILGSCDSHIQMFSLKTNSWKILEFSVKSPYLRCASYSNGALHWRDAATTQHITAFDLAKETIFFLELPEEKELPEEVAFIDLRSDYWVPFFDYQGSFYTSRRDSIWVMKEYGNTKSWTKFSTPFYAVPKKISRLGEVVYRTTDDYGLGFVKSDITGRISDDDKSRLLHKEDVFGYNETLISPKCFDPK